jgi:predicted nucleic acid-binding protein
VSYLIDTNVVSELARPHPATAVTEWFKGVSNESLFLSALSIGELRRGVESLPAGAKRERLRAWLENDLQAWFGKRLLPIDAAVADRWGRLLASASRTLPAVDALLAATALCHDLRLVTRNVADFDIPGLEVLNPWKLRP